MYKHSLQTAFALEQAGPVLCPPALWRGGEGRAFLMAISALMLTAKQQPTQKLPSGDSVLANPLLFPQLHYSMTALDGCL